MLTNEQIQDYVSSHGSRCPYCGSQELEGDRPDIDSDYVAQPITCKSCKKSWFDLYKLAGIEEIANT